ncbi:GL24551 [Drosophila persimilis]|uniref:GL24551 n=1 Tax=Drosophila persimilis TaxID=7234 RepID=B4G4L2_DROPE|nr:GL24551 [Drosophila persimilis]
MMVNNESMLTKAPPLTILEESLYYTLTRVGWPLALCWIIFACMQGYGGLADSFLSSPLWQPLSRLSYSVYIWNMFTLEPRSPSEQKQSSVDVQQDQFNVGRNLDEPEKPKEEATTTVSE